MFNIPFYYGIGSDLRFKKDAYVVIFSEELPDSELVRQLISRGVRSLGRIEGTVYCVGSPESNRGFEKRLLTESTFNYYDGAKIIKAAWSIFLTKRTQSKLCFEITEKANYPIFTTEVDWLGQQCEAVQKAMAIFFKIPKPFTMPKPKVHAKKTKEKDE